MRTKFDISVFIVLGTQSKIHIIMFFFCVLRGRAQKKVIKKHANIFINCI